MDEQPRRHIPRGRPAVRRGVLGGRRGARRHGCHGGRLDASGHESIFVTNLTREGATLYRNSGKADFTDVTSRFGLSQPTFAGTGFGVDWFDYDNDGRPDLFIANGAVTLVESLRGEAYPFHQHNVLLHNEGTRFREASEEAGPVFSLSEVGRGVAFGDIDNNGTVIGHRQRQRTGAPVVERKRAAATGSK